ncbi:MarC family protein [Acidimangrovimonas sediminis]|uniref:MarC family protein n=1 Tax=Acidimangrovimonas sediminis TaxID=2056283 RepID=UPI000C805BAD|nr:MarC family protein [Acidimangrovimonas sediminis]
MDTAHLITAFVTLFVIVDPVGLAPVFVALTRGMGRVERRAIGLRAALVGAALMTLFGLAGQSILDFVGISIPAFRIAGGLLLFVTAFDMLFERRARRREDRASADEVQDDAHDPSVFPLATPLIAGPGALVTMILLVGRAGPGWQGIVAVHLVMLAVVVLCVVSFLLAGPIERALGKTGTDVVSRLLGMLLAALSVQFVIDGIMGALRAAGLMVAG